MREQPRSANLGDSASIIIYAIPRRSTLGIVTCCILPGDYESNCALLYFALEADCVVSTREEIPFVRWNLTDCRGVSPSERPIPKKGEFHSGAEFIPKAVGAND